MELREYLFKGRFLDLDAALKKFGFRSAPFPQPELPYDVNRYFREDCAVYVVYNPLVDAGFHVDLNFQEETPELKKLLKSLEKSAERL